MRPLNISLPPGDGFALIESSQAKPFLEAQHGDYCAYCELPSHTLEVEHIIPRSQAPELERAWSNLLLACRTCNGTNNKGSKVVNLQETHYPHLDNTLLSFEYHEGGFVVVNRFLVEAERRRALSLLDLLGLNKRPGTPGFLATDSRWRRRRVNWEKAQKKLEQFEQGQLSVLDVVEFALENGSFSIWYTVFQHHPAFRLALIAAYHGTALDCFDHSGTPVHRPR